MTHDTPTTPIRVGELVEQVRKGLAHGDNGLLRDMDGEYPHLKKFLLGDSERDRYQPAGSFSISRRSNVIVVTLRLPNLGVEAHFQFVHFHEIWEVLENSLGENTVPWQPDWRRRKKEDAALSALMD